MTEIARPVLRYHGGKYLLAPWIISHFPKHKIYTEVFGGAASVLMQKKRSYAEVYNDQWDTVVNVFKVLRDKETAAELERQIRLTPYSRTEFNLCGEEQLQHVKDNPIEFARRTILRSFAGFGSASTNAKHSTGFRSNANRSGTTPAKDWFNYPDHLKTFTERLKGVIIENRHYGDVLLQHDSTKTLHFLDPPYVHSTRNLQRGNALYAFEMSDDEHIEMINTANALEGMVIICGYESELYQAALTGWQMVKRKSFADGAAERVECLWLRNIEKSQLAFL